MGYSNLPRSVATEISALLDADNSMALTENALKEGFPLLVNPLVNTEHTGKQLDLSILFMVPGIPNMRSFAPKNISHPLNITPQVHAILVLLHTTTSP